MKHSIEEGGHDLMINQSDLSRHGCMNEEFTDLKNRVVNFSSKKNNFA